MRRLERLIQPCNLTSYPQGLRTFSWSATSSSSIENCKQVCPFQEIQQSIRMYTASTYTRSHTPLALGADQHITRPGLAYAAMALKCCRRTLSTKHHCPSFPCTTHAHSRNRLRQSKIRLRQRILHQPQWPLVRIEASLLSVVGRSTIDLLFKFFSGELGSFSALLSTSSMSSRGNAIAVGLAAGSSLSLE